MRMPEHQVEAGLPQHGGCRSGSNLTGIVYSGCEFEHSTVEHIDEVLQTFDRVRDDEVKIARVALRTHWNQGQAAHENGFGS
jgi:hypothetical protein